MRKSITERSHFKDFYRLTKDILTDDKFKRLKELPHHGNADGRYEHCVAVAYYAYVITNKLGWDDVSTARGGLLHDYFFEDWRKVERHEKGIDRIKNCHGMAHPKKALKNASADYDLNAVESNMILRHMFPLTITPPKYKESWVISIVDKGVAVEELVRSHTPRKVYLRHRLAAAENAL